MIVLQLPLKRFSFSLILLFIVFSAKSQNSSSGTQRFLFNKDWHFNLGDVAFPEVKGHDNTYMNAKAGQAGGAAAPEFDDHLWTVVKLPHDWAADGPIERTANLSQGFKKRGFGWYRKQFKLDSADRGKHLELQFEGIATHATIWLNGSLLHRNWCGYTSAYIDITAFAKYGDAINTIAVRVDADAQEGWWYEGAGIYRDTWLIKHSAVHVLTDGVYANPVKLSSTGNQWLIPGAVVLQNSGKKTVQAQVEMSLWDAAGKLITKNRNSIFVPALDTSSAHLKLQTNSPSLWSVDHPQLYRVKTIVKVNGLLTDSLWTTCGFRTIKFDADSGFYLNGVRLKIKGVCNHHDHAGVGVALPVSIAEFRLRKLKEMGVNAYRCSHNPPSVEFLDLCDRLGIMVMDENRNFNSSPEYVRQLQWMVRRDRNHPSIILWSVFNEEPMQGTEQGYEMVRRMSHEVKKLDVTRPVTAAMNGGFFETYNVSRAVDVVGFNYQVTSYDRFHQENPALCMTSSEDVSAFMTRGAYKTDTSKHILDAYDTQFAKWGTSHRTGWKLIAERPFMAGAFVWTGFDYHGEPSPFGWPSASSFFGAMDICGFPKTAFYLHQAQWVEDKPVLHVVPEWNWPVDSIGKNIKVMALSNVERIELFLNGKKIGAQKADKYEMNTWNVPYRPGKLMAVGYTKGREVARYAVETTGKAVQVKLVPDRLMMKGDGLDAMPITVQVIDTKGRAVPDAQHKIKFELEGSGAIIGLGNGDPNSHEPEKGNERSLFNGLAQLIVQTQESSISGSITIIARSEGLKPAKLVIPVRAGLSH